MFHLKTNSNLKNTGSEKEQLKAMEKAFEAFNKKHTRSKEAARKQLQKEGILTPSGRLTKNYGG